MPKTLISLSKAVIRRALPSVFHRLQLRYGDAGIQSRIGRVLGERSGTVMAGPFTGMRYSAARNYHWFKVLGAYEQELHESVEALARRQYKTIINIGCADGYYAVGFALRCPESHIYAFDILLEQQALCRQLAVLNGVADRVHIGGECSLETLSGLPLDGALIFCDCEGCELDLLQPDVIPNLTRCDLLVELHDLFRPGLTSALLPRFSQTHRAQLITTAERNPDQYPILRSLSHADRIYALREGRVLPMQWVVLSAVKSDVEACTPL